MVSAAAALAAVLGAAGAVHAGVVTWTISNGMFSDGGTLNGMFSIDTSTGDITAFDLVSTPGTSGSFPVLSGPGPTQFGTEYALNSPNAWAWTTGRGYPLFAENVYAFPDGYDAMDSELDLTSLPVSSGGTYSLVGDTEALYIDGEFPVLDPSQNLVERTLVGGEAVGVGGVPEPATWAMLILGMAMVGFAARRQREGAAVAA